MGRRLLRISMWSLRWVAGLKGEVLVIEDNDIPPDAEILHAAYDQQRDEFVVSLFSPSWPDLLPGSEVPEVRGPMISARAPSKCEADIIAATGPT